MSKQNRDRVASRAAAPQEEERRMGSDDPEAQAETLLDESDQRTKDAEHRRKAREKFELRNSEEATPPPESGA
jgi:hypothetical protein